MHHAEDVKGDSDTYLTGLLEKLCDLIFIIIATGTSRNWINFCCYNYSSQLYPHCIVSIVLT